jgi:hypothetical protein
MLIEILLLCFRGEKERESLLSRKSDHGRIDTIQKKLLGSFSWLFMA